MRVSATPNRNEDGPKLADEVLATIGSVTSSGGHRTPIACLGEYGPDTTFVPRAMGPGGSFLSFCRQSRKSIA